MTITVRTELIGKKLNRMLIFNAGRYIGEYERSQQADIARKKAEIADAQQTLLAVFRKYGEFCVRWDGIARKKSIRVRGSEVGVIPKAAWKTPSWEN